MNENRNPRKSTSRLIDEIREADENSFINEFPGFDFDDFDFTRDEWDGDEEW